MNKTAESIPICPKCNQPMDHIAERFLPGMKIADTYGHVSCDTCISVVIPGKEQYCQGPAISG